MENDDIMVTSSVLEDLFGVGDRMIRNLAEQGVVKKSSRGKYMLKESTKNYITLIKAAKQTVSDGTLDLEQERAQHEHIKRQITEIKLQLIKGQVHKAEDVEAVITDMFAKFKSKISALPAKLARKVEGEKRIDIQHILRKELDDALLELAEYNPADFYSDEHIDVNDEAVSNLLTEVRNE